MFEDHNTQFPDRCAILAGLMDAPFADACQPVRHHIPPMVRTPMLFHYNTRCPYCGGHHAAMVPDIPNPATASLTGRTMP